MRVKQDKALIDSNASNLLHFAIIKVNSQGNRCNVTWYKWNEQKGKTTSLTNQTSQRTTQNKSKSE